MCRCPRSNVQVPPPWRRALVTSSDTTRTTVSAASGATAGCRKPSRKARAASRASATAPVERAVVALTVIMFIRVTLVCGSSMPGLRLPDPCAPPLHPPTRQSHSACRRGLRTTVDAWPHADVRPCHDAGPRPARVVGSRRFEQAAHPRRCHRPGEHESDRGTSKQILDKALTRQQERQAADRGACTHASTSCSIIGPGSSRAAQVLVPRPSTADPWGDTAGNVRPRSVCQSLPSVGRCPPTVAAAQSATSRSARRAARLWVTPGAGLSFGAA